MTGMRRGRRSWWRGAKQKLHPLHGRGMPEEREAFWRLKRVKKRLRKRMRTDPNVDVLSMIDAVEIVVHAQNLILNELEAHEQPRA